MDEISPIDPESPPDNQNTTPPATTITPLQFDPPPPQRSTLRTTSIILILCLTLFISALDQTIISTTIPTITKSLNSAAGYTWIGASYLLAICAANPIWIRISDIWGRKPALLSTIVIFAIGSLLAATSRTMAMLIAGRAVQGLSGGGLMALVNIVISDLFSMRHRALYISATALVWVLAGTTGPVIGGALAEFVGWRWCFWINLPVCGVAFIIVLLFLDLHNPRTNLSEGLKAVDWLGGISILAVILLLLLGLDFGGVSFAWSSATVICMIVVGTVLIGMFLFVERKVARYPLMHLGVFNHWENVAVILVAAAHSMATRGAEYYLPFYFQSVKGASPTRSGVLVLPMMIAASVSDVVVGVVVHKTGRYREVIWLGSVVLTLGTGLYVLLGVDTSLAEIIVFQVVGGVGLSLLLSTPMLAIQNTVRQGDVAVATATLGFVRSIATSLAVVIGGVVFQDSMAMRKGGLVEAGLDAELVGLFGGEDAAANVDVIGSIGDVGQQRAVREAYACSIRNMFVLYTAAAAVGVLAAPWVRQRVMSGEHTETKTGVENMRERGKE
ncbi:hypothetical protein BO94DRAFT_625966 [Aspergillus sclerotioniger CBS 115572]|uniref:Major facilitator superfamily (MFS) profile domain-containing protein n=1 Tax=Aspergillus sclerotioniger CBS 115572 TaxID=1450535 RepID=A0A317W5G5_9EURO|nr:hypothetical protein BO94DRAFT_625966 [Aspergillus sclerotioniger CBS 115572]PWY80841.1 hypothetical protein BO94DRAFT_625966 [Aspergillus sclerotioniger CBS 115572]